jgi:hypothetical protein
MTVKRVLDIWTVQIRRLRYTKTPGTDFPVTQRHATEARKSRQRCSNLNNQTVDWYWNYTNWHIICYILSAG